MFMIYPYTDLSDQVWGSISLWLCRLFVDTGRCESCNPFPIQYVCPHFEVLRLQILSNGVYFLQIKSVWQLYEKALEKDHLEVTHEFMDSGGFLILAYYLLTREELLNLDINCLKYETDGCKSHWRVLSSWVFIHGHLELNDRNRQRYQIIDCYRHFIVLQSLRLKRNKV